MNDLTVKSVKANGGHLTIDFECRGQIGKFFRTNHFYADYDTSVEAAPDEILVVPFLGAVLPIVWANHAVICINAIDEVFLESMETYKKSLQELYPKLSLGGRLVVKHSSKQNLGFQSKSMMLFSGGVDSLATYVRHKNEHLTLVCVHGGDINLEDNTAWKNAVAHISEFACNNKSLFRTVRSNFREMVDFLTIRIYDDYINGNNGWWGRVMCGLSMLSLCAPLAYVQRIGKLYIAASHTPEFSSPWGTHPLLDEKVKWTDTDVVHDGYELNRQEKLLLLSKYVKNCNGQVILRSCWHGAGGNCGHCEKCSRTILGLELAGLDPNNHGFKIKPDTFVHIKRELLNGGWTFGDAQESYWEDIKRHAYLKNNIVHPEAKSLIDWLENMDVSYFRTKALEHARTYDFGKKLNPFFMSLPDPLHRISRKCYFVCQMVFPFLE